MDNDLEDDLIPDNDGETRDVILTYFPPWFATYEKVYKSRNRRYFIERKDIKNERDL